MGRCYTFDPMESSITVENRSWRWIELILLFIAAPASLYFVRREFGPLIIPTLLVTSSLALVILLRDRDFDRRQLGGNGEVIAGLKSILRTFIPGAALIAAGLVVFEPELLFRFPRREPWMWAFVMVAYPLLSVYPQELLFRTYFFQRYAPILRTTQACVLWSAFSFGVAHLFFANWVAPTLTAIGGYLFARTYARSRSTVLVTLEHALWGDFLFTIGLGWYFWGGSLRVVANAATGGGDVSP